MQRRVDGRGAELRADGSGSWVAVAEPADRFAGLRIAREGSVFSREGSVNTHGKGSVFGREGSGSTKQRQYLSREGSGNTQGKCGVSAAKAVETQGKGGVSAAKAVETQGKGSISAAKAVETHKAKAASHQCGEL